MSSYSIRRGQNPRAFVYSIQAVMDNDGLVEVFADVGAELQVDFASPRLQGAIERAKACWIAQKTASLEQITTVVEQVGDIVYDVFGRYNQDYVDTRAKFSPDEDSAIVGRAAYDAMYDGDDGQVLQISEINKDKFICPEFAAVTAVLCHYAGLNAYIARSPVVLGTQRDYANPSVYGGHSAVMIVNEAEEIICLAENSTLQRHVDYPWLWQSTVRSLKRITLSDFLDGTPFVGMNCFSYTILMAGDPIGLTEADYFEHSQFEGMDYTIRDESTRQLFEFYRGTFLSVVEESPYFVIKRIFEMEHPMGYHVCGDLLPEDYFLERRQIFLRTGSFVMEWLVLKRSSVDMSMFTNHWMRFIQSSEESF